MNKIILSIGLTLALTSLAPAAIVPYLNGTGGVIADNGAAGLVQTITTSDQGSLTTVSLSFTIAGGYNGDLYGYLSYNDGVTAKTLEVLNRMGGGSTVASGAGFAGVTLMDGGSLGNIHAALPGAGTAVAVGSYLPDSAGVTFASTFGGMNAGGTWTLAFFDRVAGDQSTLGSWSLNIDVAPVPEPINVALGVFGAVFAGVAVVRRRRRLW